MSLNKIVIITTAIFFFNACTNQEQGPIIPGIDGPYVNIQDENILISLTLENIDIPAALTLAIPKMESSSISIGPANQNQGFGGTHIQVFFDMDDVYSEEFQRVAPQLLPDGRPFPFMIDGTLPSVAIHVPKSQNMTYYISEDLFGFYLPINLPDDFQEEVNYRIRVNGENFGIVSLILPDEQALGEGLVVLLTLKEIRNSSQAQKLLHFSKHLPQKIF